MARQFGAVVLLGGNADRSVNSGYGQKGIIKCGGKDRLGQEHIHTRFPRAHFHIRPVVGRYNNDGCFRPYLRPHPAGHLNAVDIRHFQICEAHVVVRTALVGFTNPVHTLLSGQYPVRQNPHLLQHQRRMNAAVPVVIRDQHLKRFQFVLFLRDHPVFIRRRLKIQFNGKHGSFSHLTLHGDGTAHQSDQVLCDRHSQSGASECLAGA